MTVTRYDACVGRKGKDGKTYWTKIGSAFPSKQGDGLNVVLDALPMPNGEGQAWISLFVPRDKNDAKPAAAKRAAAADNADDMDDGIPF